MADDYLRIFGVGRKPDDPPDLDDDLPISPLRRLDAIIAPVIERALSIAHQPDDGK